MALQGCREGSEAHFCSPLFVLGPSGDQLPNKRFDGARKLIKWVVSTVIV
jgi:hypothetical protein